MLLDYVSGTVYLCFCVSELTLFAVSLVAKETPVLLRIATPSDLLQKHLIIYLLTYLLVFLLIQLLYTESR